MPRPTVTAAGSAIPSARAAGTLAREVPTTNDENFRIALNVRAQEDLAARCTKATCVGRTVTAW